jgi:hypothetical protein
VIAGVPQQQQRMLLVVVCSIKRHVTRLTVLPLLFAMHARAYTIAVLAAGTPNMSTT